MTIKLLPEHHLDFQSLKGGCKGGSELTLVKMPHCWKSHVTVQLKTISVKPRISIFELYKRDFTPSAQYWQVHKKAS